MRRFVPRPITTSDLYYLASEEAAAWLAGFIVGDGSVCYSSRPKDGRRYFEARVRIGIYEIEPIEKAAKLMGSKRLQQVVGVMRPMLAERERCP